MEKPLVSIITITLNRCDLIHKCIESIQNQTYQNYEHIIVDGNSEDKTEEVVKSYNDPHIKYIKLDQRGPQVQMKAGSTAARGKYVTFLDDDDEYLPRKIEKEVNLIETLSEDYGLIYCWMSYYNNDEPDKVVRVHATRLRGYVGDITPIKPLVTGNPTLMIRREVFNEFGGTYDDSIGIIMSDWELVARITQKYKVDFIPESLVKVYVNHGHARLSTDFYQEKAKKGIIFHTHFLSEFADVFSKNPKSAYYHYYSLCRNYATIKDRPNAWKYWKLYVKSTPKMKDAIKSLIGVILLK